jgi:hypothetical protein
MAGAAVARLRWARSYRALRSAQPGPERSGGTRPHRAVPPFPASAGGADDPGVSNGRITDNKVRRRSGCSLSVARSFAPIPSTSDCRPALALSIEIFQFFWRGTLRFLGRAAARAVSTDRSGGHEASSATVHVLRIGGMTVIRPHPRGLRRRGEAAECSIPPDDAVGQAFRCRRPGELAGGCPAKKFRYSAHSEPAATRRGAWRCRGLPDSNQIDERSVKKRTPPADELRRRRSSVDPPRGTSGPVWRGHGVTEAHHTGLS